MFHLVLTCFIHDLEGQYSQLKNQEYMFNKKKSKEWHEDVIYFVETSAQPKFGIT